MKSQNHRINAPKRCNCIVWAGRRFIAHGGYLAFRKSFLYPFIPHVFWSRNMKVWWGYSILPEEKQVKWIWFRGHLVVGDFDAVHAHMLMIARLPPK